MNDIRNEVRRQILSLSGDELLVATAILLSLRMKGTGNVDKYGTVPEWLTKAHCKRLIKAMRSKCTTESASVRETGECAVDYIRNVWIPQIMHGEPRRQRARCERCNGERWMV